MTLAAANLPPVDHAPTLEEVRRAWRGWTLALEGHPFVSVADLFGEIERGEAQWWRGALSDVFSRISPGAAGPVLELGPVSGDVAEMIADLLPRVEAFGRSRGCVEIFIQGGRQAWSRALRPHGFEEAAVILRKAL